MRFPVLLALFALAATVAAAPIDPAVYEHGGVLAFQRIVQPLAAERRLNTEPAIAARLRALALRLRASVPVVLPGAALPSLSVDIATEPGADLIAFPGDHLLAHTGLVRLGLGDDELGAVLACVLAQALLGHDRSRIERAVDAEAARAADPNRRALAVAAAAIELSKQPYAAGEIAAADRLAVKLAARAALDPRAAVRAWRRLDEANAPLVRRHPVDEARLAALDAAAQAALPAYEEAAAKAAAAPAPRRTLPPLPGTRQIR